MKQPVKTGIKVDTIIDATIKSMERTVSDPAMSREPIAIGIMAYFVEAVAEALFTEPQQEQIKMLLTLWNDCHASVGSQERARRMDANKAMQ